MTVEAAYVAAARPIAARVWAELDYLGTSGEMISTEVSTRVSILDTTTLVDASTQAWKGTVRANSTAKIVGDCIEVASNPGRLFYVTTAGTTAASEPASYATAVDGDTFTDGTAIVRCIARFKFTFSVTPNVIGFARVRIRSNELVSNTKMLIDPKIRVS